MKRIFILVAVLLVAASFASASELSPDRSHVQLSNVPRECLESGSAESGGFKYTCTKVDTSEVWNELELRKFEKDIFEASKQPVGTTQLGLVVRQDTMYTIQQPDYKKQVAKVESREQGYKYRYVRP